MAEIVKVMEDPQVLLLGKILGVITSHHLNQRLLYFSPKNFNSKHLIPENIRRITFRYSITIVVLATAGCTTSIHSLYAVHPHHQRMPRATSHIPTIHTLEGTQHTVTTGPIHKDLVKEVSLSPLFFD